MLKNLIVMDRKKKEGEIVIDFDYDSFKYEYEKNNERQISFTIYKTNRNTFVFNMLQNEAILIWEGQEYVIKSTNLKSDNITLSNEIVAKHIFMDFQYHYIEKDLENEELNSEENEETKSFYTLKQYLDFGFEGNELGYTYEIKADFSKRIPIDELGDKNGLEYLVDGAELFNYIYFADNKKIYIYDENTFYNHSGKAILYNYNTDEVSANVSTLEMTNYIKGYGKKKTKSETKNYNPIKPPQLDYIGGFIKKGTWRTEKIDASYTIGFECKWGNETLEFNLKKGPKGGIWDVYLDGEYFDTVSCFNRTMTTQKIIIAKNLTKGKHSFEAIFKGKDKNYNYKDNTPTGYIGTKKATVLNLTAVLKGKDLYHYYKEITTPNAKIFGKKQGATVYDDKVENQYELEELLREKISDEPTVELTTNYTGEEKQKNYIHNNEIKENHLVRLKHKPLGFDTDLKVVKLTEYHPLAHKPVEVDFSNSKKDIIQIQQLINQRIKKINKSQTSYKTSNSIPQITSRSVGSVLLNE